MKIFTYFKILVLSIFLCSTVNAYSQGTESFDKITKSSTSYTTVSWTGDNGLSWEAMNTRTDQKIGSSKAICIRQTKEALTETLTGVLTGTLTGEQIKSGVGVITFTAKNTAATSDNVKSTTYEFICGSVTKTVTIPAMGKNAVTVTSPEINSFDAASIIIKITGEAGVRVTIDDLSWSAAVNQNLPSIITNPITLNQFSTTTIKSVSQAIKVGAINLTDFLELKISGADAGLFTVTPDLLMPEVEATSPDFGKVADTDVTITYAPKAVGTHAATLTLSSLGAADVTFDLSGTAVLPTLATPVATEATSITEKSFTANWNAVPNATEYELKGLKYDPNIKHDGTEDIPYTVANSRTGNLKNTGWIVGYIVGTVTGNVPGNTLEGYVTFGAGAGTVATNLVLAESPTERDGSKLIAIQLNSGAIRTALNLVDKKDNVGKVVKVKGTFGDYFGANPGVKSLTSYVLDATIPGEEVIAGSPFTVTDATSFEITGLKHNTDYKYSVVAKGAEHLNSEPSNVITVKTADIIPTEVSSIGDITDTNVYYKVTEQLEGVYQVGNVAYVKGAIGGNPNKTTRPDGSHPGGDLDDNFEQSSWMKITAPDAQNYEGSTIDAGLMGKLNAKTGAFDVVTMPAHNPKTDAYAPFYKSNTEKYNSFTLKNFFPQAPGYYFIAPQNNEVAFLSQLKYRENEPYFYITETKDGVTTEVKFKVIPTVELPTDKLADDAIYNCKAIFLKQPKVENPQEMEWVFEHLGGGSITTGVNDIIVNGSDVKVIGTNGAIEVYAAQASAINVYNLSGAIVRSINNADSYTSINIPAGAYIVKVQNSVVKVIVK